MNAEPASTQTILMVPGSRGLGTVLRDMTIVDELRRIVQVDVVWLTAHPNTLPLQVAGERLHPFFEFLESASEIAEHAVEPGLRWNEKKSSAIAKTLHRKNMKVIKDAITDLSPDLVATDCAPEIVSLLATEPAIKRWPLVYIIDSAASPTGVSGMPALPLFSSRRKRHAYTRFLDEHITVEDAAIFIGDEEDIGGGEPEISAFIKNKFEFVEYSINFEKDSVGAETHLLKKRLGYDPNRPLVLASAGSTAAGREILEKADLACEAMVEAAEIDIQLVLVTGPRLSPNNLKLTSGYSIVKGYIPNLYEHFAVADFVIVPASLYAGVELASLHTPFIYVPVTGNAEHERLISSRLDRFGAGKRIAFSDLGPNNLAAEFKAALDRPLPPLIRELPLSGARLTAEILAEKLSRASQAPEEAITER